MTAILCTVLFASNASIPLHTLTLDAALRLNGTAVVVRFEIGTPPMTYENMTAVGPEEQDDDVERNVYLKGKRFDLDVGHTITVRGTLRVIRHAAIVVEGVLVPEWVEIRVDEGSPKA